MRSEGKCDFWWESGSCSKRQSVREGEGKAKDTYGMAIDVVQLYALVVYNSRSPI